MTSEFSAVAGHRVLDLVNTVDWRLSSTRRAERLVDDAAAVRWARQFGFCAAEEEVRLRRGADPGALMEALRDVRERIYLAAIDHDVLAAAALQELHRSWQTGAQLSPPPSVGEPWVLELDLAGADPLRQRVARAAVDFLASPDGGRVSQCADDACGWVFLDTSPRRNRRWCVATDCGARNRARRHYERTRVRPERP